MAGAVCACGVTKRLAANATSCSRHCVVAESATWCRLRPARRGSVRRASPHALRSARCTSQNMQPHTGTYCSNSLFRFSTSFRHKRLRNFGITFSMIYFSLDRR
ncbi:uncharacterized protein LOC124544061 [Vanessa cardui]|uniref:uncharacterized protein LOC124544061 n=1 Tax=Vanessa cardui TaxID=171605 RepID=UPI001F12992C|nr:uncharacterized protein LOC124544061 [Vanessa cardui]